MKKASEQTIVEVQVEGFQGALLNKYAPVPDFFYDVQTEVTPIASSVSRVRMFATMLYLFSTFVLFGSFGYYYMPEQRNSEFSTISSDWQKDGHVCKPLQRTIIGGLSTDWGYDECVEGVVLPSAESVNAATKHLNETHFDYEFASDGDANKGVVSFYDARYDSSVLQLANMGARGYSCFPEPPYQGRIYNVPHNYTECFMKFWSPLANQCL